MKLENHWGKCLSENLSKRLVCPTYVAGFIKRNKVQYLVGFAALLDSISIMTTETEINISSSVRAGRHLLLE